MAVLGLDIGGANLKAAHSSGQALSLPFALWKSPDLLPDALGRLLQDMPPFDGLAVTMTGELCDCFENKRQGVLAILDALTACAGQKLIHVWRNDGRFVDVAAARTTPLQVASGNWLALATFAGRYAPKGPALLIDIGSTTTDIVPLRNGRPKPTGRTDLERLHSSELVYSGVRRTPLCALLASFGAMEVFATTLDLYLLHDFLPEDPADCHTADGRPATKAAAEARIARMLCADLETCTADDRLRLTMLAWDNQMMLLCMAFNRVVLNCLRALPKTILFAGEGEFLIRLALKSQRDIPPCRVVSLSHELGPAISRSACAYAVAMLAAEH
ncbi:MAG TPA: hydantoinase/oxoprolinase family protein [Gemmataceae bacterium]|nr:hydantoinase/oxoprolinase family protein [Gemmataceae bacterium]